MNMKKKYLIPAAKIHVAETADFCDNGSTGTNDAFGNRAWLDEDEEANLPKPKDLWKE